MDDPENLMENFGKTQQLDNYLPIANIGRIIKSTLPNEAKLSKNAKETFQACLSEFISFITSEACDKCSSENRKTIKGEDIIYAMNNLGFERYNDILTKYLAKYRESQNNNVKEDKKEE